MTNEDAKKMLKAKLECLKHETSGTDYACNQHICEGCSLNYEQGNMGEQKQALDMAIKALEQQSSYNSVKTELDHVIDEIIIRIEETRDKDKLCEYPYNRCIDIVREVLG